MSKKPYIIQQDSPNLVIVPTDSETYEPSSKNVKLVGALLTPSQNYDGSVFVKKYSAKSNFNRVNNNVLIDVSKVQKPPSSWAANFLQSIGGPSTKYTRIYPSSPKSPSFRNNNRPEYITDIAVPNTTIPHQTNTITTEPTMEEKKSVSKININLIKPKPKPALQSTLTKEASQSNINTKYHQSKIDTITSQAKVHKEPSLPKSYKIPMQSKNKPVIQPVMVKESIRPPSIKETSQKGQPIVPSSKSKDIYDLKQNKLATRETTSNKSTHPKRNKDPNQPKHELLKTIQPEINRETTHKNTQGKTKKIKFRQSNENHTTKVKYIEQIIPPKTDKGTEHNHQMPIRNKENSQPKCNKEIKQCKAADETALPRKHKDHFPPKSSKETCLKTNENIVDLMKIKETSKIKNIQEPTFSTKLKTKKEHIKVKSNKISKISSHSESMHSQESKTKRQKDKKPANENSNFPQALLEKEDIVTKLKKKRTTKKDSTEYSEGKNKKLKKSESNTTKKEKARANNEERLSKSISPIKSVVAKIKSDASYHNSNKRYHKESDYYHSRCDNKPCTDSDSHCDNSQKSLHRCSDVDLRTKLKRKLPKVNYSKQDSKWEPCNKKSKFATVAKGDPFVPEENLIISFNTKDDSEENVTMKKSPVKKLTRKKASGGNKCKKIKLEINIVFGGADTTDDESIKSCDDTKDEPLDNMDLSFLDDFNVDEIVESLNECKDCSTKTSTSEDLPVSDVTAQSLSSETQRIETTVMRQDNVLLNENDIKIETEVCKEISLIENIKDNHETALQSTVNNNRPCHREEYIVHSRINSGISTIKEEVDIVPTPELPQNGQSQETKACISSSEVAKVNSSLENTIHVHQKTKIPIDIDKPQEDITSKLQVSDSNSKITNNDKRSTTSQNNCAEAVKKTPTNNDTLLVAKTKQSEKTEIIADTKEIKPRIVPSETLVANSSSTDIIHPDHKDLRKPLLQGNSKLENVNNLPTASINNNTRAGRTEVTASGSVSTQKLNKTSKCIKHESDVITIDDSESEHETDLKDNQPVKDKKTKDIQLHKESPLDSSDDVIIIENTESILILDTYYKIEENDITKTQPKQSENLISAEQKTEIKIELDDTTRLDKTVIEDTFVEMKSNTTEVKSEGEKISLDDQINKETKSELAKPELQLGIDENADVSNNANLAKKPTSTTADEPSSKKPTETDTVVPEKSSPKKAIATTKQQNVNTKLETKAPNQSIPQEYSENKDKITKNNDKVERNLVYNHFIEKAETKLFFFMGRKCIITDVIRIGKFSKIYLCKNSLKQEYALKALKIECDDRPRLKEQFQKEKMLLKLQNGVPENNLNCVRLLKGFVICGLCCFLMEYYPSNLQQALAENNRSFHIDDVQVLSRQLVSAVTILRNNNIIHSDIKPSHILINAAQTRIKLCGFDQSSYIEDAVLLPNTGTVNYRAPELILGYPAGYAIDVWSTALVMYEMATNTKLFPGIYNNNILYQQLCTLGSISMEMLMQSKYRSTHFRGAAFARIVGSNGERVIIDNITFNGKIDRTLLQTYESEWGPERGRARWRNDNAKLSALSELLQRMLAMHPRYRIAIEFVFANPFIYESFDKHY